MVTRREAHQQLFTAMEQTLLGERGVASAELRRAVLTGAATNDPALDGYLHKVRTEAWKVLAEELKALQGRYSDDELFDLTLCAGFGATRQRHEAAMNAIDAAWSQS